MTLHLIRVCDCFAFVLEPKALCAGRRTWAHVLRRSAIPFCAARAQADGAGQGHGRDQPTAWQQAGIAKQLRQGALDHQYPATQPEPSRPRGCKLELYLIRTWQPLLQLYAAFSNLCQAAVLSTRLLSILRLRARLPPTDVAKEAAENTLNSFIANCISATVDFHSCPSLQHWVQRSPTGVHHEICVGAWAA